MHVLLLEDDENLRYTFSAALSQQGFDVVACASIPQTEKALLDQRPNIAVLDLMIGTKTSLAIADLTAVLSPRAEIIFVTGSGNFPHA